MLDQRVDFKIAGSTSFQSATLSLKADSLSLCNDGDSDASTRRRIGRVIPFTDLRSVAIEDNDGMQLVHLETKLGHLALRPDAAIPNCG